MTTKIVNPLTDPGKKQGAEKQVETAIEADSDRKAELVSQQTTGKYNPITREGASQTPSEETITHSLDTKSLSLYRKNVLTVLALQVVILSFMYSATYYNSLVHHTGWPVSTLEEIANYNFVGITTENPRPSAAAVIIEVLIWGYLGVGARQIYYVSRLLPQNKNTRIDFLYVLAKLLGEGAMGVAISVAVVAFFLSTNLTIAQVELTLQNANILTIIALSFALGFYYEDTQRLLGSFHKSFSRGSKEIDDTDEGR